MLDNGYDFKWNFTPLLKDFDIRPVLIPVKIPQANAPVDQLHKEILNMLVTKDIDNNVFDHIYPWGETLAYIAWTIRASYHSTIMATPGQSFFGRDTLFNLVSVLDWRVVTSVKQHQVDIDNVRGNSRQVTHEYAIAYLFYAEMTGIYRKLDYRKQKPNRITEVF